MSDTTNSSVILGPLPSPVSFTWDSLPPPSAVIVNCTLDSSGAVTTLSVDADPVPDASTYLLTVSDNGGVVLTAANYSLGTSLQASALKVGISYQVSLSGVDASTNTTGEATIVTLDCQTVPNVSISSLDANGATLQVAFTPVSGANNYVVQVLDQNGNALSPPLIASGAASPILVDTEQLDIGATWLVQICAEIITTFPAEPSTGDNQTILTGPWSAADSFVQIAATPLWLFYPGTNASSSSGNALLYTIFNGVSWTPEAQVPNTIATQNPGLIVTGDTLYCYHMEPTTNDPLVYNALVAGSWQADTPVTTSPLASGPSLCSYNGDTYCVYSGSYGACSYGNALLYNILEGSNWVGQAQVPVTNTSLTPSAIVFNNLIYCFHQGNTNNGQLWYNIFNGTSWQGDKQITASTLVSGVSACLFNGSIYCFYSNSAGALCYNTFTNGAWKGEATVPSTSSTQSPAAIVFNNQIYCFHCGATGSNQLRYNVFDGTSWLGDQVVATSPPSSGPGVVLYALPSATT